MLLAEVPLVAWGTGFGRDPMLSGHAGHLGNERAQQVHHRIDGFLELLNFSAHINGNVAGEMAAGNGSRHLSARRELPRASMRISVNMC